MNCKKSYKALELEVLAFTCKDVITASDQDAVYDNGGNDFDWDGRIILQ